MNISSNNKNGKSRNRLTIYLPIITIILIVILYNFSVSYSEKLNFKWDGIRANIKDTILKFDNYGTITSNGVGYSGRTPQQWYRQNWINKNLTTEELEKLTHYPSGNIKGIAYVSLLKRNQNKSELLRNSIKDTSNFIFYQNGCIERGYLLSEYINLMCNIENHQPCCSIELTENERNDFLSKLKILKLKKDSYIKEYFKRLK